MVNPFTNTGKPLTDTRKYFTDRNVDWFSCRGICSLECGIALKKKVILIFPSDINRIGMDFLKILNSDSLFRIPFLPLSKNITFSALK